MTRLKSFWLSLGWHWRALVIGVAVVAVIIGVISFSDYVTKRRYETKIQGLEKAAREAETKATEYLVQAEQSRQKAVVLEVELKTVNQQLLDLNAELQEASRQSVVTRKIYVESKEKPTSAVPLSGNLSVDAERVVSKLRELGH